MTNAVERSSTMSECIKKLSIDREWKLTISKSLLNKRQTLTWIILIYICVVYVLVVSALE